MSDVNDKPSVTAELVGAVRALHVKSSANPLISDPLALCLCSPFWRSVVKYPLLKMVVVDWMLRKNAPIQPAIVVRARYSEDKILQATSEEGTEQLVILGAGYDSIAYRHPELEDSLTIFEIDKKPTQQDKLRRLKKAQIRIPPNINFVEADLNKISFVDGLRDTRFDFDKKTLVLWMGVTYYLSRHDIEKTLSAIISHLASGSSIIFDYLLPPEDVREDWKAVERSVTKFVKSKGEPWISRYSTEKINSLLHDLGYGSVENSTPEELDQKYTRNRDDLDMPYIFGFCLAAKP